VLLDKPHSSSNFCLVESSATSSSSIVDRKIFSTIIFTLYLALTLIRFLNPAIVVLTSSVVLLGMVALIFTSFKMTRDNIAIYFLATLLIIFFLASSIVVSRDERIVHVVLFVIFNSGIALLLLKEKIYSFGPYLIFYGLCLFFLKKIIAGEDPLYTLEIISGNGIPMMMLVACISLYIVTINQKKTVDIYPAIFTFLICIWGAGRSGILASLLILIGIVYVKYPIFFKFKYLIILSCGIFVPFIYYFEDIILFLSKYSYFKGAALRYLVRSESGPDIRLEMWGNYFNNLDISRVIFGANVLTDPWPDGKLFAYNYHNSFIHLHLQTGLAGLGFIGLIIFSYFELFRKNKILFVLLVGISTRAFTDAFIFFESWDFLFYYLVAYVVSEYLARIKLG
jgi:hypothetical protein